MTGLLDAALRILHVDKNDIEMLGSGFESLVIERKDGMIFKIAKTVESAQKYTIEFKILPQIREFLEIEIPLPLSCMHDPSIHPSGIMSYKKLMGTPLHPDLLTPQNLKVIAKQLAAFIIHLHQIPIRPLVNHCPQESNNKDFIQRLREETLEILTRTLTVKELQKLAAWWEEALEDHTFFSHRFVLCHGDLWYENILVDDSCTRITGIIDFSHMVIGDPAKDLATQRYLGNDFYNQLLSEYKQAFPEDSTIEHRVQRHLEMRELGGLLHALKHDISEVEDAISKIRGVIF